MFFLFFFSQHRLEFIQWKNLRKFPKSYIWDFFDRITIKKNFLRKRVQFISCRNFELMLVIFSLMSYTVDVFPTQNLVSKITIIRVKKGCLKTSIIFRVLGWTTFFKERYRYYFSRWDHKREDTDVLLHPNFHYILCCVMSMKSSNIYHAHVWEKIKILANQTLLKIVLFFLIIRRQNKFLFLFVVLPVE